MNQPSLCPALGLYLALALAPLHAAPGDVWIVPPASAPPGSSFSVDLHVDMGSESYGAGQYEIRWDPALLEVDLAHGISGVSGGPGTGAALPPTAVNTLTPGLIIFNSLTLTPGLTAEVLMHTVGFNVLGGAGQTVTLSLVVETLARFDGSQYPPGVAYPHPGGGGSMQISDPPPPVGTCGDIDGDGDVDILDAFMTAQVALQIITVDPAALARADVDNDGGVDIIDALLIAMNVLGLPVTFDCPIGPSPEPPPVVDPLLVLGDFDLVHYEQVDANTELLVEVYMNAGAQTLGAYDVTILYDPSVLEAVEVLPSSTSLGLPLAINIDNPSGQVIFNDFNLFGADVTGVFDVATIRFAAIGSPGVVSPMDGQINTLADDQFQDIGAPAPKAMVAGAGQVEIR